MKKEKREAPESFSLRVKCEWCGHTLGEHQVGWPHSCSKCKCVEFERKEKSAR